MKRKTNQPAVNGVDNNPEQPRYYITAIRKRDGKEWVRMTLLDEAGIAQLTDNLSKEVRRLKLSRKLLFYLMHYKIVFPWMNEVNTTFNKRLDDYSPDHIKPVWSDKEQKWVEKKTIPSSLYKTILYDAINFIHQDYPWKLRNWLPDRFKDFEAISKKIIQNTDPKEFPWAELSKKQQRWIEIENGYPYAYMWRFGTIKDIFDCMMCNYNEMIDQLSKYRIMKEWLQNNHSNLHDFYLYGRQYPLKEKVSSAIKDRLKSLDKLVVVADPVIYEMAFFKQLQCLRCLIDDDLLFTSVFYSYFYKPERQISLDLKVKALERVKPFIYFLKFFNRLRIDYNGTKIGNIYDLGVLLLNALAGEKIYDADFIDSVYKRSGSRGKLKGSDKLYAELTIFRQFWRSMAK